MKNLILILTILLLGITACNNSEEQIISSDDAILEQLNQQLENEVPINESWKQSTNGNLPEVGDDIYIQFTKKGKTNYNSVPISSVQDFGSGFIIKASYLTILGSINQINSNVSDCYNAQNYNFLSYKAGAHVAVTNIGWDGNYGWESNGGCAKPGIYDIADSSCAGGPFYTCPFVDPKIVMFHKDESYVLYVYWQ